MKDNKLVFILNAHLPYVRHLEYPRFLEEDWLYEAVSESYLPILRMLERLDKEGVRTKLTLSISPTLCTMLNDKPLQKRCVEYMKRHLELGYKEVARTENEQSEYNRMAHFYLDLYRRNLEDYEDTDGNILGRFKALEEKGMVEIITTSATHAYLPLYQEYPSSVNAQVSVGIESMLEMFGRVPQGFWLPECGYYPGLEDILKANGVKWFQTAAQSMLLSPDKVEGGTYRPICLPNGLVAFPRDYQATSLIWSSTSGYPCDRRYREFYRDIGYDLPMDYISPYVEASGNRVFTGFKYCAITGKGNEKKPYDLDEGMAVAKEHAENFLYNIGRTAHQVAPLIGKEPLTTIGIDCELFGHWWFEGVWWLEEMLRRCADDRSDVEMTTPTEYLRESPVLQTATPAFSSWGDGGYNSTWLDGSNAWIYRHVQESIERMEELALRFPDQSSLKKRFLNQAAREVLLSMASDWPFILYHNTDNLYAKRRLESHLENFNVVYSNMCKNAVNTEWLVKAEKRDVIFKDIDYNVFAHNR